MNNPKNHPLWHKFAEYAGNSEGEIDLDDSISWMDYWQCFLAGASAQAEHEANVRIGNVGKKNA